MAEYGVFAQCNRFLLAVVNVIFLILGLVVFITAIVLRWGGSQFSKLINIAEINTLIEGAGSISAVTIFFLILGGFIIILSLFGILGVRYMNRFFLIVYEIIIIVLFLAQVISILVVVFSSSKIEEHYREGLNKTVESINKQDATWNDKCTLMKSISDIFHCCGANGRSDFNETLQVKCCQTGKEEFGCADKSINDIKNNVVNLLVIPTSIILGIEFFAMLIVPFLVGRAANKRKNSEVYATNRLYK
jgi:hypothetical protein